MSTATQQIPRSNGHYPTPLQFTPYRHSPLPTPTSIRLLSFVKLEDCIRAVSYDGAPLLELRLETVDLDNNPNFNCLSYTWGNWEQRYPGLYDGYQGSVRLPIIVNGHLLYITRNLHDALWQFGPWGQWYVDGRFDPYNKTELIRAAEEGQSQAVRKLLEKGADLNACDRFGETALHYAAENGHLAVVETLLKYGADANKTDHSQRAPKDCCLQRKHGEWSKVVELLNSHTQTAQPNGSQLPPVYPLTTPLWADAICIDQQNLAERAFQVSLMSRIYSSAESVLIWLGLPDHDTQPTWELLTYAVSDTNEVRMFGSILAGRHELVTQACSRFFLRRWFWRRWIIQEMALARKLKFFCGAYEFDWQRLSSAVLSWGFTIVMPPTLHEPTYQDLIKNFGTGHSALTPFTLAYVRSQTHVQEQPVSAPYHSSGEQSVRMPIPKSKLSLLVLLILSWRFDTTDPRDRIYALLGVAQYFEDKASIIPDYTISISDLYTHIGKLFVEARGTHEVRGYETNNAVKFEPLEGLSFVQGSSCGKHMFDPLHAKCACVTEQLPSWVPDFNGPLSTIRIHRERFCATSNHTPTFYPSSPHILKLAACRVDVIVETETNLVQTSPRGDRPCRFYDPLSWLEMTCKLPISSPTTGHNRAEVLWRTLMVDDTSGDPATAKSDFKALFCEDFARQKMSFFKRKRFLGLLEQLHKTDESGSLPSTAELDRFVKTFDTASEDHIRIVCADEGSFRWRFAEVIRKRGLVRTRGGMMGLGPRWSVAGDEVWLLAGARTPYILRPALSGSCYRLIGEAYVHGMMYGELCEGRPLQFGPIEIH